MRAFGSFLLAAVLGSAITVGTYEFIDKDSKGVQLDFSSGVPASHVAYHVNEDGEVVPLDFTETAEKVTSAVVHIRSTKSATSASQETQYPNPFREFFGPDWAPRMEQRPSQATGSGVIINQNGYIVTNNHVVADAEILEVTLHDNRTFKAEIVGTDPDTDLALIKVDQKGLPHLAFVDSDKAKVGQWVLAVGNPFNLNSTVTAGIVSAKGRSIHIIDRSSELGNTAIESFIQTDAAINPGNSGGALVDLSGGLLGINTAIASPTGSYSGYGFAVPSNIVSKIVEDLLNYGVVQRGWLGVTIGSVNSELAKQHDLSVHEGAYISGFAENSAAREAGLKEGDVVVKIDGLRIPSSTALIETVGRHRPGDKLELTVNRDGKEITYDVILKNRQGDITAVKLEERKGLAALGIQVSSVEPEVLKKLELKNGVRVTDLGKGKITRYTEIRQGFIITKVNDTPVNSEEELNAALEKIKSGQIVTLSGTYEDFPREFLYSFRM
ncbi:MAG TPA: Do family serine endopeptidase [Cyclobacteriaceae bacterium]|nr:Do family serine endopeptidase [Cyclobacteriaceae bacterium]